MYVCVWCVHVYGGQRTTCRSWVFSFYHVSPGNKIQVISLGDKGLYGLSHHLGSP